MTANSLFQKNILFTHHLNREHVQCIFDMAERLKKCAPDNLLAGKIIANCFFEPSTRTRLSFETAVWRLGGKVIGFANDEGLSIQKGETLYDTMKVLANYADLIVIRHPLEGAAALAQEAAGIPTINAGDGANQHPTQALLDLFTLRECFGRVEGLSIALVGDLKYGRTIHSFVQLCALFDVRLYLVAPELLSLPESLCDYLKKAGVPFSFHDNIEEVIAKVDVVYMTRIQQERFKVLDYDLVKNQFVLSKTLLAKAKPQMKILHPLPRVAEIPVEIDETAHAHYFQQAANGVPVRQALLSLILNEA